MDELHPRALLAHFVADTRPVSLQGRLVQSTGGVRDVRVNKRRVLIYNNHFGLLLLLQSAGNPLRDPCLVLGNDLHRSVLLLVPRHRVVSLGGGSPAAGSLLHNALGVALAFG